MNILRIFARYALIQFVSKLLVHTYFYLPAAKTLFLVPIVSVKAEVGFLEILRRFP